MEPESSSTQLDEAVVPAVQHSIWRRHPGGRGFSSRALRFGRRLVVTLLALGMLAALAVLLWAPFQHPAAHLVMMAGSEGQFPSGLPRSAPPPFVAEDFRAFQALSGVLARGDVEPFPWWMRGLDTVAELHNAGHKLDEMLDGDRDVLMVYARAQGVSSNGLPVLHWSFDANLADGGFFPAGELLAAVSRRSAAVKLLLLDAGSIEIDARRGMLVNDFLRLLPNAVRATHDERLWVLASHSLLEQSHVSWSAERSVFGEALLRGLAGAADLDGSRSVDVRELFRYVSADVRQRVQTLTGGMETQTPVLLWGGDADQFGVEAPVLLAVGSGPVPDPAEATAAPRASRTAAFQRLPVRGPAGRLPVAATPLSSSPTVAALRSPQTAASGAAYAAVNQAVPSSARSGLWMAGVDPGALAGQKAAAATAGLTGGSTKSGADAATPTAGPATEGAIDNDEAAASGARGADQPATGAGTKASAQSGGAGDAPAPSAVPELLMRGWALRDELEQRQGELTSPVDFAPQLWRIFVQRLLSCEQHFRAGSLTDDADIESALLALITPLEEAQRGLAPTARANPEIAALATALLVQGRVPAIEAASLGLAEHLANCCSAGLPEVLHGVHTGFEQALMKSDRTGFDEWLKNVEPQFDRFVEIRLARSLAAVPELEWPLLREALQVRLTAERTAAAAENGGEFVRRPIELADRLRHAGEQALLDEIGSARFARASRLFQQAGALYAAAQRRSDVLQAATMLYHDLTFRVREYLHWRAVQGIVSDQFGPRDADLRALLSELQSLGTLLQDVDALETASLETQVVLLADTRDRLQAAFDMEELEERVSAATRPGGVPPSGLLPQLQAMLHTSLPVADGRLQILHGLSSLETRLDNGDTLIEIPRTPAPPRTVSPEDWQLLERRAELELLLAELIATEVGAATQDTLPNVRSAFTNLSQARQAGFHKGAGPDGADDRMWQAYAALGESLARLYASLPGRVESLLRGKADVNVLATAEDATRESIARLRAATNVLRIAGESPPAHAGETGPGMQLRQYALSQQLQWEAQRLRRAAEGTSGAESDRLSAAADVLREQAAQLAGISPSPAAQPVLQVEARGELSLIEEPRRRLDVQLLPTSQDETPVWLVLKYDPKVLAVEAPPGVTIYDEQAFWNAFDQGAAAPEGLRPAQAAQAGPAEARGLDGDLRTAAASAGAAWSARLPYRPQDEGLQPTVKLLSGDAANIALRVTRLASSRFPARLICKAVTPRQILTHEVSVRLPGPEAVRLQVAGVAGSWTHSSSGVTLHAFPNRTTEYRYSLKNLTSAAKTLDVQFLGLGQRLKEVIPEAELPPEEARRMLAALDVTRVLGSLSKIAVPALGEAVLPAAPPEAAAAAPPAAGDAPAPPPPQVNSGFLVVLTDTETGQQSLKHVDVTVQQPRRYLFPQVGYDFERERVTIRVRAQDNALLPPDGCRVQAEFVEPLFEGTARQLSGVLQAPSYETQLFAEVPRADGRVMHLLLHVDGYPRAFRYRVPCDTLSSDLPERTDVLDVRLTSPADGSAYAQGVKEINIGAQVDVPLGALEDPENFVEAGIDIDRDRELFGEPTIRVRSDRSVDVRLQQLAPDGRLVLQSTVGDHQFAIPAGALGSSRIGLLGHVVVGERQAWSRSLDAVVDGEPPRVRSVRLSPGAYVTAKDPLRVSVDAVDGELSGVVLVEAAFDVAQTGEFGEEPKPMPATQDAAGRWVVSLPLADLKPGTHTLLVRATDRVGNQSAYAKQSVTVLDEAQAAARVAQATSPVSGSLNYGKLPVPEAEVVLVNEKQETVAATRSDAAGQFVLPPVAPARYQLRARGLIKNELRGAVADVTVPPPPAELKPLRLQLR